MTTPLLLACGNSMMETNVPFMRPGFTLIGFTSDLVLWTAGTAFLVMAVLPALAKASLARKALLGLGLLGVFVLVGSWAALGPVIESAITGAAECTLNPLPLLVAAIAAPAIFMVHVGALGLIRPLASRAAMGVVVVASSLVIVFVSTIARENTTLPQLCVVTTRQAHLSGY